MGSTVTRLACSMLLLAAALQGWLAWEGEDWRELIEQAALALLALVLWIAVPAGSSRFQTPTAGTRGLRIALYVTLLVTALIASARWPGALDDGRGSDAAFVLALAAVVTAPFLQAERREKAT